jgi:dipeptidyl aminopeptidase/acylaminoacyl peptidase
VKQTTEVSVRTEDVAWYSDGERISGSLRLPDDGNAPYRAIVQGPGWMGLKDAKLYVRYHEALTAAGFAVLIFDYRGFGDSEGDRTVLSPRRQLEDLQTAVTYLEQRDDIKRDSMGVFGSGGTGGGNAVLLAAGDPRVRAAVSQLPVADGGDWLHRMRSEFEWLDFLESLRVDRADRVVSGGAGRLVNPREEIMVPTAERRGTSVKADVDGRVPTKVRLSCAQEIIDYKPVEAAAQLTTPLLVIAVENDATTPTDHAIAIYEAARGPKELILQRHTTHYASYDRYWQLTTPRIVAWFDTHLGPADLIVRHSEPRSAERSVEATS